MFENIKPILTKLKHGLTNRCWNGWTSSIKEKQFQGIFQGFLVPDSRTKFGMPVTSYANQADEDSYYTMDELNEYASSAYRLNVEERETLNKAIYKHEDERLTLKQTQELYPD